MREAIGFVLMCVFAGRVGYGQTTGFWQSPLRFRSTEWVGLGTGQLGSAFQLQTVNGVSKGPWFAGAGAGVDCYRFTSAPLFLSISRDISVGKGVLVVFFDGGTNLPLYKRPAAPEFENMTSRFHAGEYWSGGLGYMWKLGERTSKAVLVSVGYTVKKLREDQQMESGCMTLNCRVVTDVNYEYFNRVIQFMIGFRF